ncbi:MAG TPA: hypothetical protein P5195_06855, partial [Anaerolineae bacterium]|nr:hypothetical protein [Anaerolineae bacterium]
YFGTLVGTLAVPDPGSVALGVPTDDTVGAAVLTAEAVENAVWDAARVGHTGDGTYGKTSEWAGSIDSQQIRDAMKLAPSAGDPAAGSVDVLIAERAIPGDAMALTADERGSVSGAVWDVLRADHVLANTFGAVDEWAGGGGGGSLDPEAVRAAVWDALTSELTADGSVGKLLIEKLALLVAGSVTISVPVLPNGNARTIQGDDYLLEDGRALEWAISTTADLTDAEIAVILGGLTTFEAEMVGDKAARLELTRTETAAIPVGNHDFAIVATRKNGDVITLLEGRWRSTRRIVAP